MSVKAYFEMWALGIIAVGALYLAGLFTPVVAVVFGFMSFGAIFMGMMNVLPMELHAEHEKH
ncbi:MAG: hypothetical protein IPO41_11945 [Acidobacteria bacterium]|jgi:hypothetical protein|nr:hypothetical protein [Acidobacteriota bacterium]MBK9529002.1 hypothetical protein [Acidobacteriota bacterium]MBP7474731.1 hypothetical protein [Pyrinomonadaceae bacterium]MBP9108798.1 hypothetical protein [Pyrinomonadaceae bacterium]